jgi:hypothetical protein
LLVSVARVALEGAALADAIRCSWVPPARRLQCIPAEVVMRDRTCFPNATVALACAAFVVCLAPAWADRTSSAKPTVTEHHRLVLTDGATVEAVGPIERRGGLLLFRTAGGFLASVPEDDVTSILDVRSEPHPTAPGTSEPTAPSPAPPVIGNDDLPTAPLPAVVGEIVTPARGAGPDDAPAANDPLPVPTYATYRDREGRDEAWWRTRIAAIETDREQAAADRDRWNRRFTEVSALVRLECRGERSGSVSVRARCAELLSIQDEARTRVEDAEARLAEVARRRRALSDEARRSGALPGWLR